MGSIYVGSYLPVIGIGDGLMTINNNSRPLSQDRHLRTRLSYHGLFPVVVIAATSRTTLAYSII